MADLVATSIHDLHSIIDRARQEIESARSFADVLAVKIVAQKAYDDAGRLARIAKAKGAHDELVASAHRLKADALEIEAAAARKLADEYDGAQERGEIAKSGQYQRAIPGENSSQLATAAQAGVSNKEVFEARQFRDVERDEPGVTRRTLNEILERGDEPTKAALKREIMEAAGRIKQERQQEKKERRDFREVELGTKQSALPQKRYGVVLADPEWRFEPYSRETGMDRAADNHYPTSELGQIKARDVSSIAAEDSILFLWATAPMLPQAIEVMAAWGFSYKSHAIWAKDRVGTGYWFRNKHELLLVGTRGSIPAPAMGTQSASLIEAPVGRHSEKPAVFYEIIEGYFPTLPKIELNARAARHGWDVWGFEAPEDAT